MSGSKPESLKLIYWKFIILAVAGSLLIVGIVFLFTGERKGGAQAGITIVYWCVLARYWMTKAYKLGQSGG